MTTNRHAIVVGALAFTACLALGPEAQAYNNQQGYTNNTGQTAHDLTKILEGIHVIDSAIHDAFAQHQVVYLNGFTIIHFSNGMVPPGGFTWACFDSPSGSDIPIAAVFWTDEDGQSIGTAGAGTGSFGFRDPCLPDIFRIELAHDQSEWEGEGFPVVAGDGPGAPLGPRELQNVFWAVSDEERPMEELDESIDTDPELTWMPLASSVPLSFGEAASFDVGPVAEGDVVLVRFDGLDLETGAVTREIGQWVVGPPGGCSETGLMALLCQALPAPGRDASTSPCFGVVPDSAPPSRACCDALGSLLPTVAGASLPTTHPCVVEAGTGP